MKEQVFLLPLASKTSLGTVVNCGYEGTGLPPSLSQKNSLGTVVKGSTVGMKEQVFPLPLAPKTSLGTVVKGSTVDMKEQVFPFP